MGVSAHIASIADNRLGGWYGYRASKAALNMLVRTLAVEVAHTHPKAICVAIHPGTVDTALSRPFRRGMHPGQLQTPPAAARRLLQTLERPTAADGCSMRTARPSPSEPEIAAERGLTQTCR